MRTSFMVALAMIFCMIALPVHGATYVYTGTTWSGLVSMINTNGDGTYVIDNTITINSAVTVPRANIIVKSDVPHDWVGDSSKGKIYINMASGTAITCDQHNVVFENIWFDTPSSTSVTCLKLGASATNSKIKDCGFSIGNSATAIEIYKTYFPYLERNKIIARSGAERSANTGIKFTGDANGRSIEAQLNNNAIFYLNKGLDLQRVAGPFIFNLDCFENNYGVYIDPPADDVVRDLFLTNCIFDSSPISGFYCSGSYRVDNVMMTNCWSSKGAYSAANAFRFDDVRTLSFSSGMSYGDITIDNCDGVSIGACSLASVISGSGNYNVAIVGIHNDGPINVGGTNINIDHNV